MATSTTAVPTIDRLIRSRRRTYSIEVERDGSLVVRAPNRASMREIRGVVKDRRNWIARKQRQTQEKYGSTAPKHFVEGERFLYLGDPYPLAIGNATNPPLTFDNRNFVLSGEHVGEAQEAFIGWYRQQASSVISERVKRYSSPSGIRYRRLKITNAQRRWGSCSATGNLCFSWRLAMAPLDVIDYVVVHELAHIEHKDHSRKFWDRVESVLPDYRSRRNWLKDNDHLLTL
jgi:predicted metal-dependent hydrolase